jgi:glycosyltransferase involved in cell wall biosynthesis
MVSVIIAAYNYGRYIADALNSVKTQDTGDFECIVVDNGSTDNTRKEVDRFLTDPRFRYFFQSHSTVSSARNKAIRESKGELIQFLDADDLIERKKLSSSMVYLAENPRVDIVYSDMRYFKDSEPSRLFFSFAGGPNDKPWMKYLSGSGPGLLPELVNGNFMVISSPVIRKSVLEKAGFFDAEIRMNEDWDLWIRSFLCAKEIHYLNKSETMTLIRVHPGSLSRNYLGMQAFGLKVLAKNLAALSSAGMKEITLKRINDHRDMLRQSLLKTNFRRFRSEIKELRKQNLLTQVFPSGKPGPVFFIRFLINKILRQPIVLFRRMRNTA